MFSKNIKVVYFYLVSFVALFVLVAGLISTANAAALLIFPNNYFDPYSIGNTFNTDNERIRNLLNCAAVIAVSLPVFLIHWIYISKNLLHKKEESTPVNSDETGGEV